ncbi:MAG TPA: hypothetical protein PK957_01745 [Candidatus Dojkabacteria bacterium]|nr:hypothetical protein [Candidatus Dojkabacteria bacterium]HQF36051.1 hypothetical protein [Candidatus Dojkabacteria bacterium]
MSEIIDTTSESFDIEQDEINKMTEKISLICIKNTEKFNEISSTDYNIDQIDEYYAINRNHTIFIYIPDKQTHINKDYYGLLVHEITHSFQYQYYQQPITAILPEWFTEGQAEFERYSQIHQLEEQVFLASYNSTEYSKYLLEFNKIQTNLGKQDLYLLPLQLTDGKSLQEMIY